MLNEFEGQGQEQKVSGLRGAGVNSPWLFHPRQQTGSHVGHLVPSRWSCSTATGLALLQREEKGIKCRGLQSLCLHCPALKPRDTFNY